MHAVTVPGYTEVLCGREGEVQRRFYNDAKNAIKHPKLGERGVVVEEELFDGKTWFFYREGEHEQNV